MTSATGSLHIGHVLDPSTGSATDEGLTLPRHSLTTHGVIVGMTGSGKTGLGVVLLEEILSSGVPALIIDPKGDMGNLLLNFPDLAPADFRPWIDEAEARREGTAPEAMAETVAGRWRKGLERSGVTPERMRALRDGVDMRILTPGSSAGIGLNVLGDLRAPKDASTDVEVLREEIEGLVSGLLVLAGFDADPLTSREHILLANIVEHAWRAGRDLDLAGLLGQVRTPPFRKLGVFDLESFFPEDDRMRLAMRLNGLVASPSFEQWLHGEPLDMDRLLWAPDGRPRASIVYLSHLGEEERQFVVTLLLAKAVTWMRGQAGTSDLRAAIYIDEVFGMAPPTAEPPSKRPMLTLFKQARAHGLGLVVSTQNPVDLDYKLMSNAGTWMIGRLQTERDKARILEALESASGAVDVDAWDARIGGLGKREFLLKTGKSEQPTLFTTRWAMSYLRGPLTRAELGQLSAATPTAPAGGTPGGATGGGRGGAGEPAEVGDDETLLAPDVADGVAVRYVDRGAPWAGEAGIDPAGVRLHPGAAFRVRLLFDETRADLRHEEEWEAVLFPVTADLAEAVPVDHDPRDFVKDPPDGARYVLTEAPLDTASFFKELKRDLQDWLYRNRSVEILKNPALKLHSRVGEDREAFLRRCTEVAEDRADESAASLRKKYERKLDTARRRHTQAERKVRELEVDVSQRRQQEMVAGAGELIGMFLGGRRRTRSLAGAASRRSQTRRTGERLRSAEERLEEQAEAVEELEEELAEELEAIWEEWRDAAEKIESMEVGLEKNDVHVEDVILFWGARA